MPLDLARLVVRQTIYLAADVTFDVRRRRVSGAEARGVRLAIDAALDSDDDAERAAAQSGAPAADWIATVLHDLDDVVVDGEPVAWTDSDADNAATLRDLFSPGELGSLFVQLSQGAGEVALAGK